MQPIKKFQTKQQQSFHLVCIFIDWKDIIRVHLGTTAVKLFSILLLPMLKAIYVDLSECWQADPYNLLLRLLDNSCYLMWQTRKRKQVRGNTEPWIKGKPEDSSSSSIASDSVSFQFLVLNTTELHLEFKYRQWDNLVAKLFGPTKITEKLQNSLLEKVNIPEISNQKKSQEVLNLHLTGSAIKATLSFVLKSCPAELETLKDPQGAFGGLACTSCTVSIITVYFPPDWALWTCIKCAAKVQTVICL